MSQPGLFDGVTAAVPHKRVRGVSRAAYEALQDSGLLQAREQELLEVLSAYDSIVGHAPTAAELTDWAHRCGMIPRADPNRWRPRATSLERRGVLEFLPRRLCRITGRAAHPLRVVERG